MMQTKKSKIVFWIILCLAAAAVTATVLILCLPRTEPAPAESGCEHIHTSSVTTPADCTHTGIVTVTCDDCGEVLSQTVLLATEHTVSTEADIVEPTLWQDGSRQFSCLVCGTVVRTEALPALNDTLYSRTVTQPSTCTTSGQATYVSAEYGTYRASLPLAAHDFGAWQMLAAATCSAYGAESRACALCGTEESRSTDKTAHAPDLVTGLCTVCGEKAATMSLTYTVSADGTYVIVSNEGNTLNDTAPVVPEYYNGLPVREIAAETFAYKTWITCVTIPKTVTTLGSGVFNGCTGLEKVYWNAENCNDFNAKNWVFLVDGAKNIEIVIGKSVKRLPARFLYPLSEYPQRLPKVTRVVFEDGCLLEEIGDYAFYGADIDRIALPSTVRKIGTHAFYGTKIRTLTLPASVTEIGEYAFYGCEDLQTVSFGAGLRTVGAFAFFRAVSLKQVDLSQTVVTDIGNGAFKASTALRSVRLPSTLQHLGDGVFQDCAALERADIGNGVLTVGEQCFENCTALRVVLLPESVVSLGKRAFFRCTGVETLYYFAKNCGDLSDGNNTFAYFGGNGGVTAYFGGEVRLPENLFYGSADSRRIPAVKTIIFDGDVLSVGDFAFFGIDAEVQGAEYLPASVGEGNDCLSALV